MLVFYSSVFIDENVCTTYKLMFSQINSLQLLLVKQCFLVILYIDKSNNGAFEPLSDLPTPWQSSISLDLTLASIL